MIAMKGPGVNEELDEIKNGLNTLGGKVKKTYNFSLDKSLEAKKRILIGSASKTRILLISVAFTHYTISFQTRVSPFTFSLKTFIHQ